MSLNLALVLWEQLRRRDAIPVVLIDTLRRNFQFVLETKDIGALALRAFLGFAIQFYELWLRNCLPQAS